MLISVAPIIVNTFVTHCHLVFYARDLEKSTVPCCDVGGLDIVGRSFNSTAAMLNSGAT